MNEATLKLVCDELTTAITGCRIGRIFQLSKLTFAIDLRDGSRFLFISADPTSPRLYLITRRLREIEKASIQQQSFAQFLKKRISGTFIESVRKLPDERIVRLSLSGENEFGEPSRFELIVQLTGKSTNLFLTEPDGRILDRLRDTFGDGQETGTRYSPPARPESTRPQPAQTKFADQGSISEALDKFYLEAAENARFDRLAASARSRMRALIQRNGKLSSKLRSDLENHGDPDRWKRLGDLILANLSDAIVMDGKALVVDYFDESTPVVEIELEDGEDLKSAADRFFRKYTKARNAREELARRLIDLDAEQVSLTRSERVLEEHIEARDSEYLESLAPSQPRNGERDRTAGNSPSGTRRFISIDGFEILVGKGAKDNDNLTFRVARSNDLWFHAADYPGSHVVIRNPSRLEIPASTVLEAARLAASYSQARTHPKAAVHYTLRKNVHKPRGGVPGLVSLTSFKTIIVEGTG